MARRGLTSFALLLSLAAMPAAAYGPRGHAMVGAIADERLAGKAVANKISDLLDGLTLAEAALLPDKIKNWDKHGPDDLSVSVLPDHLALEQQLRAFVKANPHKNQPAGSIPPSHHSFHFVDIPVKGESTYASGKTGRSPFDVVQMIPFCIGVVKGQIPENNPRRITRPVAVILLAHYVGDIHQPLHVGAAYFNQQGKPVNPDTDGAAAGDNGGNSLTLILNEPNDHGNPQTTAIFHTYWDDATVTTAMRFISADIRKQRKSSTGKITDANIARRLAVVEPAGWKPPAALPVEKWSMQWADEIMPTARKAHDLLTFEGITINPVSKVAKGAVVEPAPSERGPSYVDWSGGIVRDELHKAGWRLAELLEQIVD